MSSSLGSSSHPTTTSQGAESTKPSVIDLLLRKVPTNPEIVLSSLESQPALAIETDSFGYSLLHAAISYSNADLARKLVKDYHAPVDAVDEDGETPLFYAENVDMANLLVEELGADSGWRNYEGDRFAEKLTQTIKDGEAEGWELEVLKYINSKQGVSTSENIHETAAADSILKETAPSNVPVPEMDNLSITLREEHLWHAGETDWDEGFRHRINNMTRYGDLNSDVAQAEMRGIVADVVQSLRDQQTQDDPDEDERGRRRTRIDE